MKNLMQMISEFRHLEIKRKNGRLTPREERRWVSLSQYLEKSFGKEQAPQKSKAPPSKTEVGKDTSSPTIGMIKELRHLERKNSSGRGLTPTESARLKEVKSYLDQNLGRKKDPGVLEDSPARLLEMCVELNTLESNRRRLGSLADHEERRFRVLFDKVLRQAKVAFRYTGGVGSGAYRLIKTRSQQPAPEQKQSAPAEEKAPAAVTEHPVIPGRDADSSELPTVAKYDTTEWRQVVHEQEETERQDAETPEAEVSQERPSVERPTKQPGRRRPKRRDDFVDDVDPEPEEKDIRLEQKYQALSNSFDWETSEEEGPKKPGSFGAGGGEGLMKGAKRRKS